MVAGSKSTGSSGRPAEFITPLHAGPRHASLHSHTMLTAWQPALSHPSPQAAPLGPAHHLHRAHQEPALLLLVRTNVSAQPAWPGWLPLGLQALHAMLPATSAAPAVADRCPSPCLHPLPLPPTHTPDRSHAFTRVAPEIERLFESVARRWGCCLALACSACACGCGCLHGCGAQSLARPLGGIDHVTSFPTLVPAILLSPHPLQLHGPPGGAGGRCGRRQGGRATGGCGIAHRTAASAGAVSFELLDPGRACGGAAARGG